MSEIKPYRQHEKTHSKYITANIRGKDTEKLRIVTKRCYNW